MEVHMSEVIIFCFFQMVMYLIIKYTEWHVCILW